MPQYPSITDVEVESVVDLLRSGRLSEHRRAGVVGQLEDALGSYFDVPYALSYSSGSGALHAALWAVGVRPGATVLTANHTWLSAITVILQANAIPVFCDVAERGVHIDPAEIRRRVRPDTVAVIVTHAWGLPAPMAELMETARELGLKVIEDASHAHGASIDGQKVGTFGDAGCFSLQNTKPIVAGEGGFLLTSSRATYRRALAIGHFGPRLGEELRSDRADRDLASLEAEAEDLTPFVLAAPAYKFRIAPLAAALAVRQLDRLDELNALRQQNFDTLRASLGPRARKCLTWPSEPSGATRSWYTAPAFLDPRSAGMSRDSFVLGCEAEGVPLAAPYPDWCQTPLFQRTELLEQFWPIDRYSSRFCPVKSGELRHDLWLQEHLIHFQIPSELAPELMREIAEGVERTLANARPIERALASGNVALEAAGSAGSRHD